MKNQYILLNLFRFKCNELILIDNRGNKKGEHLITFSPLNLNANSTKYEFGSFLSQHFNHTSTMLMSG